MIKNNHRSKRSSNLRTRVGSHTSDNDNRWCKNAMCKKITINRSCLTRLEYIEMLSTPRGRTWTGTRGLGFIMNRCKRKYPYDHYHDHGLTKGSKTNTMSCCHDSDTGWQR